MRNTVWNSPLNPSSPVQEALPAVPGSARILPEDDLERSIARLDALQTVQKDPGFPSLEEIVQRLESCFSLMMAHFNTGLNCHAMLKTNKGFFPTARALQRSISGL